MGELESIRQITNDEPADEVERPAAPMCPACGRELTRSMECSNPECITNDDGCPND